MLGTPIAATMFLEGQTVFWVGTMDSPPMRFLKGNLDFILLAKTIYCCQMENHLICPMQCRVNGVVINDTPKMCVPNPDDSMHSIEVADPLDPDATLHIPLLLRGVNSCFCIRKPSTAEFKDDDIPKLDMTY